MRQSILLGNLKQFLISVFIVLGLLCAACDHCHRANLERSRDEDLADLTISDCNKLGQINTSNPLILIEGSILENRLTTNAHTYAVVIPKSGDIKKSVESFIERTSKSAFKVDAATILPNNLGGVYHHMNVQSLQKGKVWGNVYVKGLQAGEYLIYLILYHPEYGAVIGKENKELEIFAQDPVLPPSSITMVDVKAGSERSGTNVYTHITMQADVAGADGMQGGFLFIEEKKTAGTAEQLIANYFQGHNTMPQASEFTKVFDDKAVVYSCLVNTGDIEIQLSKIKDISNVLQRGQAYQVYAYLINDQFHSSTNVIVSQNSKKIIIPKDEIEMTIQEAKLQAMYKCLNHPVPTHLNDIDKISIECKVNITKYESIATKIEQGYLFLKQPVSDQEAANKMRQLLQVTDMGDGTAGLYKANKEVLFIEKNPAKQLGANQTGEISNEITINQVPFELGSTYHVYACVRLNEDEIFISQNSVEMIIPHVDLTITTFTTSKSGEKFTTREDGQITVHVDFQQPKQTHARTTGHIIYPQAGLTIPSSIPQMQAAIDNVSVNLQDNLDMIVKHAFKIAEDLQASKVKEQDTSIVLSKPSTFVVFAEDIPGAQSSNSTYGKMFDGIPDGAVFQVAKVWCHGNVVFLKQAENPKQRFTWYKVDKVEKQYLPIKKADGTKTDYVYWYNEDVTDVELRQVVGNGGANAGDMPLVKLSNVNRSQIEDVLKNVFKGDDDQWVKNNIEKFMNVMAQEVTS